MPKQKLPLGPWHGGLNLRDDPQLIDETELQQALNIVIETDGSAVNRPGFQYIEPTDIGTTLRAAGVQGAGDLGERLDVLGFIGDNNLFVGKSSHNPCTNQWETGAIYRGVTRAVNPTSQQIVWSDTSYGSSLAAAAELMALSNSNFESGVANWLAYSGCSIAQDTGIFDTGAASLKVTSSATTSTGIRVELGYSGATGRVALTPGTIYTISMRIRAGQASPAANGMYGVWVNPTCFNAGGADVTLTYPPLINNVVNPGSLTNALVQIYGNGSFDNSRFYTMRFFFQMPANSTATTVGLNINFGVGQSVVPGNTFYLDNVSIKAGHVPYITRVFAYGDYLYAMCDQTYPVMYKATSNRASQCAVTSSAIQLWSTATRTSINIPAGLRHTPSGGPIPYTAYFGQFTYTHNTDFEFLWKDRMFYVSDDRVYFSAPTDLTKWTSPDGGYFTVGDDAANDRNTINAVAIVGNSLHIFKQNSTYQFTFQNDPNTDGYLTLVNAKHGASSATVWKSRIFTVDNKSIYEYSSGQFIDIGAKLNMGSNNADFTIQDEDLGTHPSINIIDKYLVVGPFRKYVTLTGAQSGLGTHGVQYSPRYFAMNVFNGAWTQWDAYGGAQYTMPVGDTDTVTCQGPLGTFVGSSNDLIKYVSSTSGNKIILMNAYVAPDNSRYIVDGSSVSGYRIPRAYMETKYVSGYRLYSRTTVRRTLTYNDRLAYHKVYRIQVDRGLGVVVSVNDQNYLRGGFGTKFFTEDNLRSTSTYGSVSTRYAAVGDHFGNMVASKFRCLGFSIFYDFYYVTQQNLSGLSSSVKQAFIIKGFYAYVDQRSDTTDVTSINT